MKRGICPKCGSTEVYAGTKLYSKGGTHNSNAIPVTFWFYAELDNYVCVDCGYVESYVADENQLRRIRENWPPAIERKSKR